MKHIAIPLFTFTFCLHLSALAAVPLRWTVETSDANPATFDQFAGATYDLEAALQSRGKPLAVDGEAQLFWQTNGMGSAWWTAPATVSGNVLRATWTPACDVGAKVYNCFIGITGTVYNAAFQLRLRPSPGAHPNDLPLPTPVIDFARVTVLNPPWSGGGSGGTNTNDVKAIVDAEVGGTNEVKAAVAAIPHLVSATNDLTSSVSGLASSKRDKTDLAVYVKKWTWTSGNQECADWLNSRGCIPYWDNQWNEISISPPSSEEPLRWQPEDEVTELVFVVHYEGDDTGYLAKCTLSYEKQSTSDALALVSQLQETAKAVFESNANPTNTVFSNAITTVVQNSGLQEDFARRFRTFGDEYVYQASRFSPFTWTGMRADAVEAIGNTQPTPDYEYGGYTEWICTFEMDGHTYWGSSYSPTAAPNAEFYFYADYYDESRGEWVYDELSLTASRTAIEYEKTNPIDTFARQSELTEVSTDVAQLRNRINGETKVLRSGRAGELGTGWGYLQSSLDGDYRNWRIRVPAWTNLSGNETNKTQSGMTYVTWTNGNQRSVGYSVVLNNPLSWTPGWDFARTVRETRGAEGVDAVQQADYDVGIQTRGSNVSGGKSYFLNYITTQDADYDFHTTAVTTGWTPTNRVYWVGSGTSAAKVTVPGYFRPIDYRVEREWTLSSGSEHEDIARVQIDIRGLFISETDLTTHQSVRYSFNVICENERLSVVRTDGGGETTLLDETLHDTVHGVTITAYCTSSSVENVYAPYYKLVGSLDSGLFYDPGLDCTFRIAVTNGCFHSDKYCDGDWRK